MFEIVYNQYRSVSGFNKRQRFLVFHYTAANFSSSVQALTGPNVSAHYLIPHETEKTYLDAGFSGMKIFNLVDENDRAWHAGASYWRDRSNLNDTAIGIEIVNLASYSDGAFTFPPYTEKQAQACQQLASNILQRYPDISPRNVVGHSDISPGRKSDPGPAFPWKKLYDAGIGAWYDDETKLKYLRIFTGAKGEEALPSRDEILQKLKTYGYNTTATPYANLVRAFQLHFQPEATYGKADAETCAILWALAEKYPGA